MGNIERMLMHFCTKNGWTHFDSVTRGRCVARMLKTKCADVVNHAIVGQAVWRCFYRRHTQAMRQAKNWNRTVARLVAQFEAEDAAAAAKAAIEATLSKNKEKKA